MALSQAEIDDKISRYLRLDDVGAVLFREWLADRHKRSISSLKGNTELVEIGRSQGRIEILELILRMKENA